MAYRGRNTSPEWQGFSVSRIFGFASKRLARWWGPAPEIDPARDAPQLLLRPTTAQQQDQNSVAASAGGQDPPDGANVVRATWVGHATVLLNVGGLCVVTDPVWSEGVGPWGMKQRRIRQVPFALESVRRIDVVLVSHDHWDHLDVPTLLRIERAWHPTFLVPAGVARWLGRKLGCDQERMVQREWWESHVVSGVEFTFVPAQHWSGRYIVDMFNSLWGGWVCREGDQETGARVYFAGDTGYCQSFVEIGQRLGPFDLSLIPIGPLEPRAEMAMQHIGPREAIAVHRDVRSSASLAIHWGTFPLGTEPLPGDASRALSAELQAANLPPESFFRLPLGGEVVVRSQKKTADPR